MVQKGVSIIMMCLSEEAKRKVGLCSGGGGGREGGGLCSEGEAREGWAMFRGGGRVEKGGCVQRGGRVL